MFAWNIDAHVMGKSLVMTFYHVVTIIEQMVMNSLCKIVSRLLYWLGVLWFVTPQLRVFSALNTF